MNTASTDGSARKDRLRQFYLSTSGKMARPLEYGDPVYVPRLSEDPGSDPILALQTRIGWATSESVDLLTGYRGNGKSTELRRLKKRLEDDGCRVFLVDMIDYVMMSKPLELSDFVLSLMSAFNEAVQEQTGLDQVRRGYWERLADFMQSEVRLEGFEVGAEAGGASASLGTKLQTDPTFKQQLQQHLRGHLTTLVRDARGFVADVVNAIRQRDGDPDEKVVLLVDSLEQLRGSGDDAESVQRSVVELFTAQAANLRIPMLHVVYTVPPFLMARSQGFARLLGGDPIVCWPNIHVRTRDGSNDDVGLEVMEQIITRRFPGWGEFFQRAQLRRLAAASGGDIRDYFRLVRECLVFLSNSGEAAVTGTLLARVEGQLRSEHTPIARDDARWLARVHRSKRAALETAEDTPRLARFLDNNLIMNYLNGEPWYDVHPLIIDEIDKVTRDADDG